MQNGAKMDNDVMPESYPEGLDDRLVYETRIYDKWYKAEDRIGRPFFYHDIRRERRFVKTLIKKSGMPQGSSLVDIGCGNGMYSGIFRDYGMNVKGIDISEKAIEFCNGKFQNEIEFTCGDALSLGHEIECDYGFCSFFTLFNAFDTGRECREYADLIMNHIKKDGLLFFIWYSDLTAIRLPFHRFNIMNFTIKQLREMFNSYHVESYAFDGGGRLPGILGRYAYNKWITRLSCALVQMLESSWTRVRIILMVHK